MEYGLPTKYKTIKEDKNLPQERYFKKLEETELVPEDRDDETSMKYTATQYRNKNKSFNFNQNNKLDVDNTNSSMVEIKSNPIKDLTTEPL